MYRWEVGAMGDGRPKVYFFIKSKEGCSMVQVVLVMVSIGTDGVDGVRLWP